MDEGSREDFTLPRRVCNAEKLPGCIACKNFGAVERYFGLMHNIVWQNEIFVCERAVPT